MGLVRPLASRVSGRPLITLIGAVYIALALGWTIGQLVHGEPLVNLLTVPLMVGTPGVVLVLGSYRLSQTDIDPDFYGVVGRWCLASIGAIIGVLVVYHVQPADDLSNPRRGILILSALSSVAGFGVGIHDARAKTRAREVAKRNRELRRVRAELERSNERLEQFAYAASHDLEEPLRMVTSYLSLLEDRYADDLDEDAEEFIEYAVDGAERMKAMIDALLQYSRVETQGEPLEPVDLEEVLATVRKNLEVQVEESDATIERQTLPRVLGDRGQLQHVFQNLLSNAIEYSEDEPPRVTISADRDDSMWTVSVRDHGIGIPPEHQEDVFEVFERLHTHDEHAGTGIGLALCRRIVERHGGDIWVDSEPGEGATFSLTLPAVTRDANSSRVAGGAGGTRFT
ncbi:ATP-binding protein [Halostagnicola kamekurae]|uniref:histidine kinase n=1 Tax=Halostagnicola kamekurae TaxID=619731 RepID=A0A1I6SQU9_9EURY|nr:ATP-binding protein [Halostagnicola kamekurae]SFS79287.1 4TM region of histidine kinase [Halostagnicola kamekurae]